MCAHYLYDADFCNVASVGRRVWWRRTCRTAGGASGRRLPSGAGAASPNSMPGSPSAALGVDHPDARGVCPDDAVWLARAASVPLCPPAGTVILATAGHTDAQLARELAMLIAVP